MNESQETKNPTTELNLNQVREWLWQTSQHKTKQDWEQLQPTLKVDYPNLVDYEKVHMVDNYQRLVIDYLFKWGWEREKFQEKDK